MCRLIIDGLVLTASGRKIPAPNAIRLTSNRKAQNDVRKLNTWLIEQAQAEASARRDEWNEMTFGSMVAKRPPPADVDLLNDYLFGETYPVFLTVCSSGVHLWT